jgi:hypothetical protein
MKINANHGKHSDWQLKRLRNLRMSEEKQTFRGTVCPSEAKNVSVIRLSGLTPEFTALSRRDRADFGRNCGASP